MINKIIFLVFVFLAITYSFSNLCKAVRGQNISAKNIMIMALGLVGMLAYFMGVY